MPIALDADGRTQVFLYLLSQDLPIDFRGFLERHGELLRALPAWTLRLLLPRHKRDAIPLYQVAFDEQLAAPLRPSLLEDLRWYFHASRTPRSARTSDSIRPFAPFGAPRFQALYRVGGTRRTGLGRHLVDDVGRRNGPQDGPVGLPCLTASVRTLFPLVGTA